MTNRLYDKGREGFLAGDISWRDDTIKAVLVDLALYTPNFATDQFLSDIPSGARIAISPAFATKTVTAGVANAGTITYTAPTGPVCEALAIYQDTGVVGTSRLIAYIDTATNLPVDPSGVDINVAWDTGANKIFKL